MILLGIISFFQLAFIPGFLLMEALGINTKNRLEKTVLCFALSLYSNYILVYFLTAFSIYKPLTVYIILALEITYIAYMLIIKKPNFPLRIDIPEKSLVHKVFFFTSMFIILSFLYFFFTNLGSIFYLWDPFLSWNGWAIDWYLGQFPLLTDFYPQLIPANWSLSYKIASNHYLHLFAKSVMPLFSILNLVLFFNLYLLKKNMTYLLGLIAYSFLVIYYAFNYINSGYVDIATSFFMFLTVYLLITSNKMSLKRIILITIIGCSAALTKQAGFYVLIFAIAYIIYKNFSNQQLLRKAILAISGLTIFSLSWYIQKAIEMVRGTDTTYIVYLTTHIHRGRNLIERFAHGIQNLEGEAPVFAILLIFTAFGIFNRKSRLVTISITFPLVIIWGLMFSYDNRNFFIILPFLAFSLCLGWEYILSRLPGLKLTMLGAKKNILDFKLSYKPLIFTVIFLTVIFLCLSFAFDGQLEEAQIEKQKKVGNENLNKLMYQHKENNKINGKILTDYYWITAMPGFEGKSKRTFKKNENFVILSNGVFLTD
ncbi:MAG: hypothetical protein ACQEP2_07560, partial [Actinomycetota bacterium]